MADVEIRLEDNSEAVLEALRAAALRALERCGLQAEGYAKDLTPVDTGNLRNSITHQVSENGREVYIGTNMEYAPYVELGTGIYAEGGGGRPTPWVYQDAKGQWHWTRGNPARPLRKPAVSGHAQTYRNIIEDEGKKGES